MNSDTPRSERVAAVAESLAGQEVLVAFSGGVDSTVLASIAKDAARRAVLLTITSQVVPDIELKRARAVAEELGMEHHVLGYDWLGQEELARNPIERCYLCKSRMARMWKDKARELGLSLVVEGTTASDVEGYRPGAKALREAGVKSPFLEAGMTKDDIRAYARERGLSVAEVPSMACLATRFPYGTTITEEMVHRVHKMETAIMDSFGVERVRARYDRGSVRIEVGRDELTKMFDSQKISALVHLGNELELKRVTLDLEGYRTGSMDEDI
ncbi:MAG: ATP-dependent sacrificial sulfur transferase LarE [Candidatus Thorarchaeota archaeon]|nr:MAG: ATP-dependent sacrificial sulfur transferase LarE [Candidatus Thorarchaeota archaeon]RLI59484.1 MAG: ATP-dependent sacrificial sulfur transferase LarE [Candidatus Thorarchaeota archaeon]